MQLSPVYVLLALVLATVSARHLEGGKCTSRDFFYFLGDGCFYDPVSPDDCDPIRKRRTGEDASTPVVAGSSPELAALLNASAPMDGGFLTRVIQNIYEARQEAAGAVAAEGAGVRHRRFFGAGYLFGIAYSVPLLELRGSSDAEIGAANFRLDFSVWGVEINGAYSFFLPPCEDGEDGDDDDDNCDCYGSLHTKESIPWDEFFFVLDSSSNNVAVAEDENEFLFYRRKEAYAKSRGFFGKEATLDVAFAEGLFWYYMSIGKPIKENKLTDRFADWWQAIGGFGGAALLGGALYLRNKYKKQGDASAEAVENHFEQEPALETEAIEDA